MCAAGLTQQLQRCLGRLVHPLRRRAGTSADAQAIFPWCCGTQMRRPAAPYRYFSGQPIAHDASARIATAESYLPRRVSGMHSWFAAHCWPLIPLHCRGRHPVIACAGNHSATRHKALLRMHHVPKAARRHKDTCFHLLDQRGSYRESPCLIVYVSAQVLVRLLCRPVQCSLSAITEPTCLSSAET